MAIQMRSGITVWNSATKTKTKLSVPEKNWAGLRDLPSAVHCLKRDRERKGPLRPGWSAKILVFFRVIIRITSKQIYLN